MIEKINFVILLFYLNNIYAAKINIIIILSITFITLNFILPAEIKILNLTELLSIIKKLII